MALAGVAGTFVVAVSLMAACCAYSIKNRRGMVYVTQQQQQPQGRGHAHGHGQGGLGLAFEDRKPRLFHFRALSRRRRPNAKARLSWVSGWGVQVQENVGNK